MTDMISEIRVIKSLSEIDKDDWNTVAAVGNFDGVHLGHQKIIEQAKMLAKRLVQCRLFLLSNLIQGFCFKQTVSHSAFQLVLPKH